MNGVDTPICDAEASDLYVGVESRAVALGLARHGLGWPGRLCMDVGRDVERAQDAVGEHGNHVPRLAWANHVSLDAPAHAEACLALKVFEALGRPGNLEAADRIGARLPVEFEALPEIHSVAGESGHCPGRVDLEDEAGRV